MVNEASLWMRTIMIMVYRSLQIIVASGYRLNSYSRNKKHQMLIH